jgi:hypothetical protein
MASVNSSFMLIIEWDMRDFTFGKNKRKQRKKKLVFYILVVRILQTSSLLKIYMVINFKIHEISRNTRKLTWISTLIIIKKLYIYSTSHKYNGLLNNSKNKNLINNGRCVLYIWKKLESKNFFMHNLFFVCM